MQTKKVYLVRHGQTDYNLRGMVQGSGIDAPLNDNGREQARSFFEYYQGVGFDKIYISALQRTQQSVQQFIDKGIAYESLKDLNEISWGKKEGMAFTPEENRYYFGMIKSWQEGNVGQGIEDGESPMQVAERLKRAFTYIMSKSDESTILICMHGRSIRILMTILLNYDLRHMDMFEHSNLCLYQLHFSGSMWSVERYNDLSHEKALAVI